MLNYKGARRKYLDAVNAFSTGALLKSPSETLKRLEKRNPIIRRYLSECVGILNYLYLKGKVESVEGLPSYNDVLKFNKHQSTVLIVNLRERFFPTEQDISRLVDEEL